MRGERTRDRTRAIQPRGRRQAQGAVARIGMHRPQPLQAQADEAGQCVLRCAFLCIACRALVQPELAVASPGGHADDAVVAFDFLDAAAYLSIGQRCQPGHAFYATAQRPTAVAGGDDAAVACHVESLHRQTGQAVVFGAGVSGLLRCSGLQHGLQFSARVEQQGNDADGGALICALPMPMSIGG